MCQVFTADVILSNFSSMPVFATSIKVELVMDKGSTQLLAEWVPPSPIGSPGAAAAAAEEQLLPPGRYKSLPIKFDVRELGPCNLSCSAVFKGD